MGPSAPGAGDHKDAVFFSPHKLIGGPQTPGVLVVRRDLAARRVPTVPGGGTIAFVDPVGQVYLEDPVAREEGGTSAIVESVRAGLVLALKQAVGTDLIREREQRFLGRALERWRRNPNLELLGNLDAERLPIVSFRVRHGARYLHHELVVAMLSDLFGIQARGGCSCAGPYGHRLLGIDPERSRALSEQAGRGYLGIKPGWVRVSFNCFISEVVADFLVEAVDLLAGHGHRLLGEYRFDPCSGHWRHRLAPPGSWWPRPARSAWRRG
jgi:selenocysteine lyase/cysteine desulfurase